MVRGAFSIFNPHQLIAPYNHPALSSIGENGVGTPQLRDRSSSSHTWSQLRKYVEDWILMSKSCRAVGRCKASPSEMLPRNSRHRRSLIMRSYGSANKSSAMCTHRPTTTLPADAFRSCNSIYYQRWVMSCNQQDPRKVRSAGFGRPI